MAHILMFVSLSISVLLTLLSSPTIHCYPTFRDKIPNGCFVPNPCNTSEVWCGVGHQSKFGAGVRNPFGLDFYANNKVWDAALCNMDSDGDGKSNGFELGDPNCTWTEGSTPSCNCSNPYCDCGTPLPGLSHPGICEPLHDPRCLLKNSWLTCRIDYNCSALDGPNVTSLKFMVNNVVLQPKLTTYYCQLFELPGDTKYHMIGTAPLVQNYDLVHHMTIFGCKTPPPVPSGAYECTLNSPCLATIGNYERALPFDCLPPDYGFPIGSNDSFKYVLLQVHYNNPTFKTGIVDTSGLQMFLTPHLRPNDGGAFVVGQMRLDIPPGLPRVVKTGYCTPACGGPQGPINITRLFLHMHALGRAANISHYRGGSLLRYLRIEEPFSVYSPTFIELVPFVEFWPGDELRLDCVFDSTSRQCTTHYGSESVDEMCYLIPTYFPLQVNWDICVQYKSLSACSNYFVAPGCNFLSLNQALASLRSCSFVSANPCAVSCFAAIVQQIQAAGCLQEDVRDLMVMYLEQQYQAAAVPAVNLLWACAGFPTTTPSQECLNSTTTIKTPTNGGASISGKSKSKRKRRMRQRLMKLKAQQQRRRARKNRRM